MSICLAEKSLYGLSISQRILTYGSMTLPQVGPRCASILMVKSGIEEVLNLDVFWPVNPTFTMDITKVVELRQVEPDFDFYISHSEPFESHYTKPEDFPKYSAKDDVRYIEKAMSKILPVASEEKPELKFRFQLKNLDDAD